MRRTFGGLVSSICNYQAEVDRVIEAKKNFIRYIFHEVRVPFNSVVLCTSVDQVRHHHIASLICSVFAGAEAIADTVHSGPGPANHAQLEDLVELLQDQCAVVSRILNDVLSLQKIEDGGLVLELTQFSPDSFLTKTVESFRTAADAKSQRITVSLHADDANQEALVVAGE